MLRSGQRLGGRLLDVKRLDSALGYVRVGLVVPKLGFSAVQRNRLKRRLRELTRQHLIPLAASSDVLLRAKRDTYAASFDSLRAEVVRVASLLT